MRKREYSSTWRAVVLLAVAVAVVVVVVVVPPSDCSARAAMFTAEDEDNTYTSETHGFTIERPDATWFFQESLNRSEGLLTLTIQPAPREDQTTAGLIQVTIRAKHLTASTTETSVRDKLLADTEGKPEYTKKKKRDFRALGRKAPGLEIEMQAYGTVYRVHICCIVTNDMVYTLQCHAPKTKFEDYLKTFRTIWSSFAFAPISEDTRVQQQLAALGARCGSEVEWAASWEQAAKRARKEKKLVLVYARFLSAFNLSDTFLCGPLMDTDIVDLVNRRFVALRFKKGMEAPFTSQESYGMGPSTFGASLLLVTSAGEVVGDTASLETTFLYDFLNETLAAHSKLTGPPRPRALKGGELAAWYLQAGEHVAAARVLEKRSTAEEHRLMASLYRRERRGEEALAELERARQIDREGALAADLGTDEGFALLRMSRFEEARQKLEQIVAQHATSTRAPEARYWLAACRQRLGEAEAAEAGWRELIAIHAESRWAWRAAAVLQSTGFSLGIGQRLDWPSEEVLAACRTAELTSLKRSRAQQAEREALGFLLTRQRPDGSWISPSEVSRFSDGEPGDFTMAITAICGQSLLPFRDEPGIAVAIGRSVDYLLAAREREKARGEKVYFMDYAVYSKAYILWFFADCVRAGLVERKKLQAAMEELIPELRAKQRQGGGWSYYLTTDLANADKPANQSISFVTALDLIAILEARDAGVAVPPEMIDAAAGCLERMANPNGTFEYMLFHDQEDRPRGTGRPGAAGRGPLCSLALLRAGRGDLDGIRRSLDIFLDHRASFAALHGKSLMHTASDGQGSHYLMFDYAFAAAATRELSRSERARFRAPLLDQILGARTAEGGYIDNPINGPHYATAMALVAFRHLQPPRATPR